MSLKAIIAKIASWFSTEAKAGAALALETIEGENAMPEIQAQQGNVTAVANVNTAIQIALALNSIDSSLTVDQVQAGTNAALAALYAPAA